MSNQQTNNVHPFKARPDTAQHTADSLADGWEKRTVLEALDELIRELGLRERCFPMWIRDGKVSSSDARDRLQRLIKATEIVQKAIDAEADAAA